MVLGFESCDHDDKATFKLNSDKTEKTKWPFISSTGIKDTRLKESPAGRYNALLGLPEHEPLHQGQKVSMYRGMEWTMAWERKM